MGRKRKKLQEFIAVAYGTKKKKKKKKKKTFIFEKEHVSVTECTKC